VIGARLRADLAEALREIMARPGGHVAVLRVLHDHDCPAVAVDGRPNPTACTCTPDLAISEIP
jgi:hypothetical protein